MRRFLLLPVTLLLTATCQQETAQTSVTHSDDVSQGPDDDRVDATDDDSATPTATSDASATPDTTTSAEDASSTAPQPMEAGESPTSSVDAAEPSTDPLPTLLPQSNQLDAGKHCINQNPQWQSVESSERGEEIVCALLVDGSVECMVDGTDEGLFAQVFGNVQDNIAVDMVVGQWVSIVGQAGAVSSWRARGTMAPLESPGTYRQIEGQDTRLVAIDAEARAWRWLLADTPRSAPSQLSGLHLQISMAPDGTTCSIDPSGELFCLDADGVSESTRSMFSPPPSGAFEQVHVEDSCACAVREGGELLCWSDDESLGGFDEINGTPVRELDVSTSCDVCFEPLDGPPKCYRPAIGAAPAAWFDVAECAFEEAR